MERLPHFLEKEPETDYHRLVAEGPVPENGHHPSDLLTRPPEPPSLRRKLLDLILLCRPKDWIKNLFVLVPLLFTNSLTQPAACLAAGVAAACFCLWSSAVYLVNDTLDADRDRCHPRKCHRPIAAGRVGPAQALSLSAFLTLAAVFLAYGCLPLAVLMIGGFYLVNSLAYCLFLKHKVIIDVLLIAVGFVLRILGGCAAIDCKPSSWILICGFSLALLLGFGKRRVEIANVAQQGKFRPSLEHYDNRKLDLLLAVCSSASLLSYMLYTTASETVAMHGTPQLIYTIPFVVYALFRFLFKVQEGQGDGPTDILLRDPVFIVNALLWAGAVVVILVLK